MTDPVRSSFDRIQPHGETGKPNSTNRTNWTHVNPFPLMKICKLRILNIVTPLN